MSRTRPRIVLALCFVALALAARPAAADEADEAYKLGNAAFDGGRFAEAEGHYERAFAKRPSPDIAANLAQTELELDKRAEAASHLSYALRLMPAGTKPEARASMETTMKDLQSKLGALRITTNVPGAEVIIGERSVGTSPFADPVFVEPGAPTVNAGASGYKPTSKTLEVRGGQAIDVELTLEKVGEKKSTDDGARPSWPGWLMGGVGVAGAVVGGALIGVGQARVSDAESTADEIRAARGSCEPATGPLSERCSEGIDTLGSGDTLTSAGIGLSVGGGALVIAGLIYLLVPSGTESTPAATAWVTPDSAGLLFGGAF